MSIIWYISFPKELQVFRLSDMVCADEKLRFEMLNECDFGVTSTDAIFNDCFKNSFVYEFYVNLPDTYYDRQAEIMYNSELDEKAKGQKLKKLSDERMLLYQQMLYEFINKNVHVGEFAEIYTAWHDHKNFEFESPTSEHSINLKSLLNEPMRMNAPNLEERHRLTIYKV